MRNARQNRDKETNAFGHSQSIQTQIEEEKKTQKDQWSQSAYAENVDWVH